MLCVYYMKDKSCIIALTRTGLGSSLSQMARSLTPCGRLTQLLTYFLFFFIFHDLFKYFLIILNLSRFNLLMVLCLCSILFANVIPLHNDLNAISKPCPYYKEYTVYPVEKYQLPLFYFIIIFVWK